jgi:hypothetical protein
MLEAVTTDLVFHHQPEAQHPKSSAIHNLGRPITPSVRGNSEDISSDGVLLTLTRSGSPTLEPDMARTCQNRRK